MPVRLLVDAAQCTVKSEIYRLAQRYGLQVILFTDSDIGAPFEPWITKVVAGAGNAAATIANEVAGQDLVITDNEALASEVQAKGIAAFTSRGQSWTPEGPRPSLPENKKGNNKARFEAVLDDELRARLKANL